MGCAYVTQKDLIHSNEVDLNWDLTNPLCVEKKINNDRINVNSKVKNDIILSEKTTSKNVLEFKEDKKINDSKKHKSKSKKKKEPIIYGPIITMLKRQYYNNNNQKK